MVYFCSLITNKFYRIDDKLLYRDEFLNSNSKLMQFRYTDFPVQVYIQMDKIVSVILLIFCILPTIASQNCPFGLVYSGSLAGCYVKGCKNLVQGQLCSKNDCLPGFNFISPGYCFAQYCKEDFAVECSKCIDGFELIYQHSSLVKNCIAQGCKVASKNQIQCQRCHKLNQLTLQKGCMPRNCLIYDQKCVQCFNGYYLDNNTCVPDTCVKYDHQVEICQRCIDSHTPNQANICVPLNLICIDYNPITGLCGACRKGYRLVGFTTCIEQNQLCISYGFRGCTKCIIGFEVRNNKCFPRGCRQVNPNNQKECMHCINQYKLNEKGLCIAKNCQNFNEFNWKCNECSDRYFVQFESGLCKTKNCLLFDHANHTSCIICDPEYLLVNGQCHLANCLVSSAGICEQCQQGWIMNDNKNCVIRNCLTYNGVFCASCPTGKRLVRGLCIKDICLLRLGNSQCLQCQVSYYVSQEDPKLCIPYFCTEANKQTGECDTCFNDFMLDSKGLCVNEKCKKFEEKDGYVHPQCAQCESGYRPEDRYCIPNRCQLYNIEDNVCEQCNIKYELRSVPGKLDAPPACIHYNCLQFREGIAPKCELCAAGFTFNETQDQCLPKNCLAISQNSQTFSFQCLQCQNRFILAFGICLAEYCAQFDITGSCTECLEGFFLHDNLTCYRVLCLSQVLGSCLSCIEGYHSLNGSCQPLNCKEVTTKISDGIKIPVCESCVDGYVQYYNFCASKDCQSFNKNFSCQTCLKQYQLIDGLCVFEEQLIRYCFKGQYFSPVTFVCERIQIQFCEDINKYQPTQCIKCQEEYTLLSGKCYKIDHCIEKNYYDGCIKCETGYEKTAVGTCEETFPNCELYNSRSICVKCKEGFSIAVLPKRRCAEMPKLCSLLNSWGKCVRCKDLRMRIKQNKCIYFTPYCLQYDQIHGQCVGCSSGYFYHQNTKKCKKLPEKCLSADSQGACKRCNELNILHNGQCFTVIENCSVQPGPVCLVCDTNYYLTSEKQCEKIPVNCLFVNQNGKCEKCRDKYYPIENGECQKKIQLCFMHDAKQRGCLKCIQGYTPTRNRQFCLYDQ